MCVTIVGLLKAWLSAAMIHTLLRPLRVNEHHVYHIKKLFEETGNITSLLCEENQVLREE